MDNTTLASALGIPLKRAEKWAPALTLAMDGALINNRLRVCAFLAQIGHESNGLYYVKELGNDAYFAKYGQGKLAITLGNTQPGDASKFCGRGLIQITGRANYIACSLALFGDFRLSEKPELLEQPEWAAKSAAWFWSTRNLNSLADAKDFEGITRRINGGLTGLEDRKDRYKLALSVIA
ncbi:glycoside hydrolase family 19 protein [Pseudomonas sp. MONT-RG-20F-20-E-7-02]|uniref:glycoside hydrolase family 19 protein n=1 Tax=Pseudomonas sp. MONT-RG-20F-20-E-7-02 TaxID=2914979 RepID=UPI001F599A8B|nr:glycoside hydrolase family 19 protein [Pseudomonas sp. MONT-RG-20F-20-E-7-02]